MPLGKLRPFLHTYFSKTKSKPAKKNTGWCVSIQLKTTCKISGTFAKTEKHLRSSLSMVLHSALQLFLQDLFIILSRFLAGFCSVKMSQAFQNPSINCHRARERLGKRPWVNTFKTPEMRLSFNSDVWGGCLTIIFVGSLPYFKFLTKIKSSEKKVPGQRLASSHLFWPATGPYWQHWLEQLFTSVLVKVVDIYLHFGE